MSIFNSEMIRSFTCCASAGLSPRNYEQNDISKNHTTRNRYLRKHAVANTNGTMSDIRYSDRTAYRTQSERQIRKLPSRGKCGSFEGKKCTRDNRDSNSGGMGKHDEAGDIDWFERGPMNSNFRHATPIHYACNDHSEEETDTTSTSINSFYDTREEYEWGWFEDFDEYEDSDHARFHVNSRLSLHSVDTLNKGSLRILCSRSKATSATSPSVVRRQVSATFELCRTFPPLRLQYDPAYIDSKYEWLQSLPSNCHIPVKLQIRTFRIVKSKQTILGQEHHAEFLIELAFDEQCKSRWCRCSSLARFVRRLPRSGYRKTRESWKHLNESNRWVDRLELSYLHNRCKMLEKFAYMLLLECSTVHTLADLLES
uniref:Uncharacterized protein AlNc14C51G4017 n=1 Tax=Albugo laibachii Nc14 TaxID=890382 RepID=F0WBH0_9STRA|nr:conserved hypothetical protein [Albugo laibachii Nc14]|eukprot:CCA18496.1 conserved hypothetical protein [Albugo laibachii Nc14]